MTWRHIRARPTAVCAGLLVLFVASIGPSASIASHSRHLAVNYYADIFVINADGSGRTNLTRSAAEDANPAWSPDGTRIAFDRWRGRRQDIFVMAADGSGLKNLTNSLRTWEDFPAWSPDASKILFTSDEDVSVMSADGSNRVNLTRSEGGRFGGLWSPDGGRIAYGRNNDFSTDILVMSSDGSGHRILARSPEGIEAFALDWAPGGATILFQRKSKGLGSPPSDLFTMRSDGSRKTNLTRHPANSDDAAGSWSPDGRKIVFGRSTDRDNYDIYVMNADGTGKTNLTRNRAYDYGPAWSPDGTKIAFASDRGSLKNHEIFTMNADGSAQKNLTRSARNDSYPIWSPDGRKIAFRSARARVCRVPKVVGLLLNRALTVLGQGNCQGSARVVASSQPKDRVLRQRPRPGTRLPYPGIVNLLISGGPTGPPPPPGG